jgi:amino acid transporter
MDTSADTSVSGRLKNTIIGPPIKVNRKVFHHLSLIAFFAWVGLGADGLSSSSYGPPEAFIALGAHYHLGVFVALATAVTIFVIGASYSQIIELFPHGGGGYVVASKLLSPRLGMISGCALLIDYALTITVSIAAGADALFSFLPPSWFHMRIWIAMGGVIVLTLMNLRGVKESVMPLIPIFLLFFITHLFLIGYSVYVHIGELPQVSADVTADVGAASAELGLLGVFFLVMKAYSMGAGTYTGLEAVSNGMPLLREPRVQTAKRTMTYMTLSLAFTACGLMLAYLIFQVVPQEGKTLNAVLLESFTSEWGAAGYYFLLATLISEAALLFVAAQTGFLGGPRVLANMAIDWWVPKRFALLSDRFVNHNGIIIMGGCAFAMMVLSHGSVAFLVVLYSINVFITFFLSQLGIMRYLLDMRNRLRQWWKKALIGGVGLMLTSFILVSILYFKFYEGGWMTLLITGLFIALALKIRGHYEYSANLLAHLDQHIVSTGRSHPHYGVEISRNLHASVRADPDGNTAVILVDGFNGMGLHALASVLRMGVYRNFVFVKVGLIDSGNFKGISELGRLQELTKDDVKKYVALMRRNGYYAEGISAVAPDIAEEVEGNIAPKIMARFPKAMFFGGRIVFPKSGFLSRILHNYTVFEMQRRLTRRGVPFTTLPIFV